MADNRILVPVSETSTLRQTVNKAVRRAQSAGTAGDPATIVFVYVHSPETDEYPENTETAAELLNRVEVWATEDAGEDADAITIERLQIGTDEHVFSPDDVAELLLETARERGVGLVLLDPEYDPGIGAPLLRPLEYELSRRGSITIEKATVGTSTRRTPLVGGATALQFGTVFLVSFGFYQLLAGQVYWFDILTGAISAGVVAVALTTVSFNRDPDLVETPKRLARGVLYVPYLLQEIIKSNILIAAVILHPRLPIDPTLTRIRPAVYGSLPVTTLANSITLTPGTLSARVEGRSLIVHTLVPSARQDLFDGGLERAVRGVFYGRSAMRLESLEERGLAEIISFEDSRRVVAEENADVDDLDETPDSDTTGDEE